MWLFLAFLVVPILEIALFIQVGGLIGLWPTLGIVILTAVAGTVLVRSQGAAALGAIARSLEELRDPTEPIAHGAMILVAGVLLLTPGFFTDALGLALLVPGVRAGVVRAVRERVKVVHTAQQNGRRAQSRPPQGHGDVIDAEAEEVDVRPRDPNRRPSGWTRDRHPGGH